ncbi:hypothetical protein K488DRAFT_72906 [Vararia minispora EC-137]|uniref:Uncharacterized protein n=1 Tax=Vararia minispora EC-137 TaxID=1314806 RepID=A0ACB8QD49_9AGAM|nr:hypothetical protein K488DRAFT_72906 [Vararia minispora EC-137]
MSPSYTFNQPMSLRVPGHDQAPADPIAPIVPIPTKAYGHQESLSTANVMYALGILLRWLLFAMLGPYILVLVVYAILPHIDPPEQNNGAYRWAREMHAAAETASGSLPARNADPRTTSPASTDGIADRSVREIQTVPKVPYGTRRSE